jgi:hypothetical protein
MVKRSNAARQQRRNSCTRHFSDTSPPLPMFNMQSWSKASKANGQTGAFAMPVLGQLEEIKNKKFLIARMNIAIFSCAQG